MKASNSVPIMVTEEIRPAFQGIQVLLDGLPLANVMSLLATLLSWYGYREYSKEQILNNTAYMYDGVDRILKKLDSASPSA